MDDELIEIDVELDDDPFASFRRGDTIAPPVRVKATVNQEALDRKYDQVSVQLIECKFGGASPPVPFEELYKLGCVWDIETQPAPDAELIRIAKPFDSKSVGSPPGEFHFKPPGGWKNPEKIEAKRQQKLQDHKALIANWSEKVQEKEEEYWGKIISQATLDPILGSICAIGLAPLDGEEDPVILFGEEKLMLMAIWQLFAACEAHNTKMVGFGTKVFDCKWIRQRSLIQGISVPHTFLVNNRYYSEVLVDIAAEWSMGDRNSYVSLDVLSRAFGLEGKREEETTGAMFHQDWNDSARRHLAVKYLVQDLMLTQKLCSLVGVVT